MTMPNETVTPEALSVEVSRCHARLEIDHVFIEGERKEVPLEDRAVIPDGIACRDETIRLLEARIETISAENERLWKALEEIANLSERPYDKFPSDWRDQIAACSECQRYKDHPIQQGICDDHRKPLYDREDHNRHETSVLGYRAKSVAREALAALEALSADKEASAK